MDILSQKHPVSDIIDFKGGIPMFILAIPRLVLVIHAFFVSVIRAFFVSVPVLFLSAPRK